MKSLWVPVSGAIAKQRYVETLANNIANANTAGFKRDQMTFKEHLTALEKTQDSVDLPNKEFSPSDFYHTQGAENAFVKVDGTYTSFEQGQLTPTSNPLDVALHGEGFLEVLTPNGIRYTRGGALTIGGDGTLMNQQGLKVLSALDTSALTVQEDGTSSAPPPESRVIVLPRGAVGISLQGDLSVAGKNVAKLSIVEFSDKGALRKEGNSLFINNKVENISKDPIKTAIHQGFIEGSNVNAVAEMSELINANRHFESIQRAIRAYDNMAGKAANEIAKF